MIQTTLDKSQYMIPSRNQPLKKRVIETVAEKPTDVDTDLQDDQPEVNSEEDHKDDINQESDLHDEDTVPAAVDDTTGSIYVTDEKGRPVRRTTRDVKTDAYSYAQQIEEAEKNAQQVIIEDENKAIVLVRLMEHFNAQNFVKVST